jgi:hypothetical protein
MQDDRIERDGDEYLEAARDAHQALRRLLKMTEPGTGMSVHYAYAEIDRMLNRSEEAAERQEAAERRAAGDRKRQERAEGRRLWKATPRAEREHWVLNALANDRLTVTEVWPRVQAAHPDCIFFDRDVAYIVKVLFGRGELERKGEPRAGGSGVRYRYFRSTELDPRLAEIERDWRRAS